MCAGHHVVILFANGYAVGTVCSCEDRPAAQAAGHSAAEIGARPQRFLVLSVYRIVLLMRLA